MYVFLFKHFIINLLEQVIVIDMCQSNQQRMVSKVLMHFYDCRQDNVSSIYNAPDLLYAEITTTTILNTQLSKGVLCSDGTQLSPDIK